MPTYSELLDFFLVADSLDDELASDLLLAEEFEEELEPSFFESDFPSPLLSLAAPFLYDSLR
ncbi:MAG: hypothetical protein R3E01_17800 [Pirellulaceae bacterium]